MNILSRFISEMVCKIPGIKELTSAVISLTESVQDLCGHVMTMKASTKAHEQAILQLYAQQGIMMRLVSSAVSGASGEIENLKSPNQKVSKPNLHVIV